MKTENKILNSVGQLTVICGLLLSNASAWGATPPSNDIFDNAKDLGSGATVVEAGNIAGATRTDGEPFDVQSGSGRNRTGEKTVWFKWRAPSTSTVKMSTGVPGGTVQQQSQFDTQLGVYTLRPDSGLSVWNLQEVVSNEDGAPFAGQGGEALSWVEFPATAGVDYFIMVAEFAPPEDLNESFIFYINPPTAGNGGGGGGGTPTFGTDGTRASLFGFDADKDGKMDLTIYNPATGRWYYNHSNGGQSGVQWGWPAAQPLRGDFDGDGKTDPTVYDPGTGNWYFKYSTAGSSSTRFGWAGTIPVSGDFNGDRRSDLAVYFPANGTWYIRESGATQDRAVKWGWSEATPYAADFDGDGKSDVAAYYPPTGDWYILFSSGGSTAARWGWASAIPVLADYNGDGKTDLAVYDPGTGTWYIRNSGEKNNFSGGQQYAVKWGWVGVTPVPGDYDGDGQADIAVYERATGDWYLRRSSTSPTRIRFGWSEAIAP